MGNSQTKKSQDGATAPTRTATINKQPLSPQRPNLTDDQKKLIQETWKILEEDIAKVGIIVFINLFETHPDMQNVFLPFTGIVLEELKQSKQLSAHALRVMGAVQKAVARLFEPDKLETLLKELGRSHVAYGAQIEYMDYIGPQFIAAIQPSLESRWTPEVEDAWHTLLAYVVAVMKEAMCCEAQQ